MTIKIETSYSNGRTTTSYERQLKDNIEAYLDYPNEDITITCHDSAETHDLSISNIYSSEMNVYFHNIHDIVEFQSETIDFRENLMDNEESFQNIFENTELTLENGPVNSISFEFKGETKTLYFY